MSNNRKSRGQFLVDLALKKSQMQIDETMHSNNFTSTSDIEMVSQQFENNGANDNSLANTFFVQDISDVVILPMDVDQLEVSNDDIVTCTVLPSGDLVSLQEENISNFSEATNNHTSVDPINYEECKQIKTVVSEEDEGEDESSEEHHISLECSDDDKENRNIGSLNEKKRNKKLRVEGQTYKSFKRTGQHTYIEVERSKKILNPKPCTHNAAKASSGRTFMCGNVTEKVRRQYFDLFWKLPSWSAKRAYIKGLVNFRPVLRRRKNTALQKLVKRNGYDCYLADQHGTKVRVCRSFFLSTFDIKKDSFNNWVQEDLDLSNDSTDRSENELQEDKVQASTSKAGKKRKLVRKEVNRRTTLLNPKEPKTTQRSKSVKEWLGVLPKVPSHYCRSSSSRIYVESTFRSYCHMYQVYKEWCSESHKEFACRKTFKSILKNENISIFKPRKDQCDMCVGYKLGNMSQEEYDLHIVRKDEARNTKRQAISSCSDTTLVMTMDVQSVLLCPKLLVSTQYYKQKLQIHNFTIYVNNNKDVHCYIWHEADGGVTSNEFTTCLIDFITNHTSEYNKIIIISDGCLYQNKNKVLVSSLADYTHKCTEKEIEQIILEKGHTMMEVDSVHSTLERYFKPPIFTPSEYVSRMREARQKQPYHIHHVDYTFFKDFEHLPHNFKSIRPGKKVGDPTVVDIRAFKYKGGQVFYKVRHCEDWTLLPQRKLQFSDNPKQLYTSPLKIEKSKYDALQVLKNWIHKDCHSFYDNLKA